MTVHFEDVTVPAGAFISWGDRPGQHVTGRVVSYTSNGGTDFNGDVCPQLEVELTEPAASINKAGERTDFAAGEYVTLNAGLANLKRGLGVAKPAENDLIKITLDHLEKTGKGTVKIFKLQIARGAAPAAQTQVSEVSPSAFTNTEAAPPF